MTNIDVRIPVITDPDELNIPWQTLQTIIAGKSLIDTSELHIDSLDEAYKFLNAYGFDDNEELEKLRNTALDYIDIVLLKETNLGLPSTVFRLSLPELLLEASARPKTPVSEWACMILKVCHVVAHAQWTRDEDAYHGALKKIKQRLRPYLVETRDGCWIGDDNCRTRSGNDRQCT